MQGERVVERKQGEDKPSPLLCYAGIDRGTSSIVFPLPKRCEAAWEGKRHLMTHTKGGRCGWAWHGGGKRRHSSTRRARRAVEEWRRLPPPCSPTPPRRMSAHLLGNGKSMDEAAQGTAPRHGRGQRSW